MGSREEERRKLADIINHWNANRLDLFEISQPTEVSPWTLSGAQAAPIGMTMKSRLKLTATKRIFLFNIECELYLSLCFRLKKGINIYLWNTTELVSHT